MTFSKTKVLSLRKSNIIYSSSLKKSFTLIELSIVLLVTSLLFGTMLVGRQIIDRTKIHKAISEINYYESIFHQFYDTYHEVPGSFTYKTCMKYTEFEGYECNNQNCTGAPDDPVTWRDHAQWCDLFGIREFVPTKLISNHGFADDQPFAVLQASGLMSSKITRRRSSSTDNQHKGVTGPSGGQWTTVTQPMNYDENVVFEYRGILKEYLSRYERGNVSRGLDYFLKQLVNKNIMIIYDNYTTASRREAYGSALNAALASILDAKIDDGRPTTGKVMGLKGYAAYSLTDSSTASEYCYDKSGNDIQKAIYNSSKDVKYGCDLIYVMHDIA